MSRWPLAMARSTIGGSEMERAIDRLGEPRDQSAKYHGLCIEERARYHAALGLAELAAADRRRAAARTPTTCHDLTLAGTTLFAAGDLAAAEEALRRALQAGHHVLLGVVRPRALPLWPEALPRSGRRLCRVCGPRTEVCVGPLQPWPGARQGRPPCAVPVIATTARSRSTGIHRGPGQPSAGGA